MSQARYGSNSEYGRISKYDPTLERPTRLTSADKQGLAALGIGAVGAAQIGGAVRLKQNTLEQKRAAVAQASIAGNKLKTTKSSIDNLKRSGRPVNLGFDRDRSGGPLKNWANRRRLTRQLPAQQLDYDKAKERVTVANEASRPKNMRARQIRLGSTGAAVTAGAGFLGYRALKNRKAESEAGMR